MDLTTRLILVLIIAISTVMAASIQEQIDSSSDGDTIVISPGEYTEDISIDKEIALSGEDARIMGSIIITADNVKLSGFDITGSGLADGGPVLKIRADNVEISNNTFHKVDDVIELSISGTNTLIEGNRFKSTVLSDRTIAEVGGSAKLVDNVFDGGALGQWAPLYIVTSEDVALEGNTFTGFSETALFVDSTGDVRLEGNEFDSGRIYVKNAGTINGLGLEEAKTEIENDQGATVTLG
jgi:nitrous oxidase accessory protein NosD